MADYPNFQNNFPWVYYYADRDPTAGETLDSSGNPVLTGFSGFYYMWLNTVTNCFWWCLDDTASAMVWSQQVSDKNFTSFFNAAMPVNLANSSINTTRSYSVVSSPAFSTSYQPSMTNDIQVIVSISLTSTILLGATVDVQVDTGSGFATVLELSLSGLAASSTQSGSFIVPKAGKYKLIQSSGSSSIVSINELLL